MVIFVFCILTGHRFLLLLSPDCLLNSFFAILGLSIEFSFYFHLIAYWIYFFSVPWLSVEFFFYSTRIVCWIDLLLSLDCLLNIDSFFFCPLFVWWILLLLSPDCLLNCPVSDPWLTDELSFDGPRIVCWIVLLLSLIVYWFLFFVVLPTVAFRR